MAAVLAALISPATPVRLLPGLAGTAIVTLLSKKSCVAVRLLGDAVPTIDGIACCQVDEPTSTQILAEVL